MFSESKRVYPQRRERVHMVARLTKISNTLSIYFCIAQVMALFRELLLFISGNPVVFLCGQIKHCCSLYVMLYSLFFRNLALFYSILNCVLVFKLSSVHCRTRATGPAVSILISSNLCDNTSSYLCIKHSTTKYYQCKIPSKMQKANCIINIQRY